MKFRFQTIDGVHIAGQADKIERITSQGDRCYIIYMGNRYDLNHSFEYVYKVFSAEPPKSKSPFDDDFFRSFKDMGQNFTATFTQYKEKK